MKARWRILVVASAVLVTAGTPALAQEAEAPPQNDVVGPPQLQNFSLNGTVTREAPAPVDVQPRARQADSAPAGEAPRAASPPPSQPASQSAAATARRQPQPEPSVAGVADLPPPTPAPRVAPPGVDAQPAAPSPQPGFVTAAADSPLEPPGDQVPLLPWLVAALALAGTAAWYFLRQRPRESLAGAGGIDLFESPSPQPPPPAPAPAPAAKPAAPVFVSTRLRPWLEFEFSPQRAIVDEDKAAIEFELALFNSGNIPARDVLLEGSLFNAGPLQDRQIRLFFDNPVAQGDRVPVIPPLTRIGVSTTVFLPLEQVRPIEVAGRPLFVPMIAFNALYRWSGGDGQSSASYLVGKTTKSDKLAPFRLDLGPRVFRDLAAREHELRLRK